MKILPLVVGGMLVATGLTPPTGSGSARNQGDLEGRVAALEASLADAARQNEEALGLVEQAIAYLEAQADEAAALLAVLDRTEELGFTAGINYESREVLLEGLRQYWGSKAKDLPALPKKDAPAPDQPARAPRR